MLTYQEFLEDIKETLEKKVEGTGTLTLQSVVKNNGIVLDGLSLQKQGDEVSPTVYLNGYYEMYQGGMSLEEIRDNILLGCLNHGISSPSHDMVKNLTDYASVKDLVMFKVIQSESNQELLTDIPHIPVMDLEIVFYLLLETNEMGQMTALIHNSHQRLWNVTNEELMEAAFVNAQKKLPASIKPMSEVMKEIAMEHMGEEFNDELFTIMFGEEEESSLYVLTNPIGLNGAACMFYPDLLKEFADSLESDLIILPSSIHECLITKVSEDMSCEELRAMVRGINESEVAPEDVLSNQVYLYSRAEEQLKIAFDEASS